MFSVILVLRKNAVPADASAAAITLPPQPAWRGSVLTAVGSRVLRLVPWRVWRCGMPAVVASLAPWRVWRCGMLGAVVHLRSDALGTAARLAL